MDLKAFFTIMFACEVVNKHMVRHWAFLIEPLLTVWQGLLSLQKARVEGECCYFFRFFTFFHFPLSSLSLFFISSTISSISFLPFPGRRQKITHKGLHVVKPQHNQSIIESSPFSVSIQQILVTFFLFCPRKQTLIFHANCNLIL